MITFGDLKNYFQDERFKLIVVADGEPYVSRVTQQGVVTEIPAGGVAVALDPIARATDALYIARAKNEEERSVLNEEGKLLVGNADGNYLLKRLFIDEQDMMNYYYGFSNQTLWPLCHVAFEEPIISEEWYAGYKKVNTAFAQSIQEEIDGKTLVWIHDYQLTLVPSLLKKRENVTLGMFWHIPWPTWEIFRILPYKKEILESLLSCDFLAFHRRYHVRNFLLTVERELEARIDQETQQIYYKNHVTTVRSLPLGVDIDVIKSLVRKEEEDSPLALTIRKLLGIEEEKGHPLDWYFNRYKVIFGVDRLDYTKGIRHRLKALDRFFEKNPTYIGRAVYLAILAPSRELIPSYKAVRKEAKRLALEINAKYGTKDWKPIHLIHTLFKREDVLNFYRKADVCVVTPLDDGMNLVSKEFVIASSMSSDPGMLVLSQFAGSAIDLSSSLIVNPYHLEDVADAIKKGLEMGTLEKNKKIKQMADMLEEKNVYEWAENFLRGAVETGR